jgi:hypothetical protein
MTQDTSQCTATCDRLSQAVDKCQLRAVYMLLACCLHSLAHGLPSLLAAKTCFQSPPDQFNQAVGWACPSNVSSSTQLGQSCSANCAINSTGPGYSALCTNDADFWPGMNGTVNATTGQIINGSAVPRPNIVFGTWRVNGSCQCEWTIVHLYRLVSCILLGLRVQASARLHCAVCIPWQQQYMHVCSQAEYNLGTSICCIHCQTLNVASPVHLCLMHFLNAVMFVGLIAFSCFSESLP